jgi:hypothetical protein
MIQKQQRKNGSESKAYFCPKRYLECLSTPGEDIFHSSLMQLLTQTHDILKHFPHMQEHKF